MGKIVEFVGFAAGVGYEDADHRPLQVAPGACSIVSSPASPYSAYALKIASSNGSSYYNAGLLQTFTASSIHITAAYFRFSSLGFPPPAGALVDTLVAMVDATPATFWRIQLDTNSKLNFWESATGGGLLDVSAAALSADTDYRVEVIWEPGNASSAWAWYLTEAGGYPVLEGSGSGAHFDPGGTKIQLFLGGQDYSIAPTDPLSTYHGGAYVMEGVTDINSRVGGRESKTGDFFEDVTDGRMTLHSATPDCNEDGGQSGKADLDAGDYWDDTAQSSGQSLYTTVVGGSDKGGATKVPAPALLQTDWLYAQKFIFLGAKTGLLDMKLVYGLYVPASDSYSVLKSSTLLGSSFQYDRRIQDWSDFVTGPLLDSLQGVMGMWVEAKAAGKGGPIGKLQECWFSTLRSVPALTRPWWNIRSAARRSN